MSGRARDLYSGDDTSEPQVLSIESLSADISAARQVSSISASQNNAELEPLNSLPLGGLFRKAMAETLRREVEQSTLLHRLLDDIVGASFVTGASFHAWGLVEPNDQQEMKPEKGGFDRTGTCLTFAPGSPVLLPNGQARVEGMNHPEVEAPMYNGDPNAWHQLEEVEGPNHMRTRRMDLWEEDGMLHVDAAFQDSAALPDRDERMVFHEYQLEAEIEPDTFILKSVKAETGALPFSSCLQAPATAQSMVGQPLLDFRRSVPTQLRGVAGCTHLNDVLRSLQDVTAMSEILFRQKYGAPELS